ncbi:MAG: ATP-binding protein [Kouleothrix sp.]
MEMLTVPATLDALAHISASITDATCARAGLDEHAAWQVQLAVDEAATNIIQHGYPAETPGNIDLAAYCGRRPGLWGRCAIRATFHP